MRSFASTRVAKSGKIAVSGRVAVSNRISLGSPLSLGSNLLGWMAPDQTSTLTIVGGNTVSALNDAGFSGLQLTSVSSPRRPGYSASSTGGKPCLILNNAANTSLSTSSGGILGTASHSISVLVEFTDSAPLGMAVGFGGTVVNGNSVVGLYGTSGAWGGGIGLAAPLHTIDSNIHVVTKTYDQSTQLLNLYIDGHPADLYGLWVPNVVAGWGIFPWTGGATTISSANLYQAVLLKGVLGRGYNSDAWMLDQYMTQVNPSVIQPTYIICIGDSLTGATNLASGVQQAQCYPTRLQSHLSSDHSKTVNAIRWGNAGYRTDQILAACPSGVAAGGYVCDPNWSPVDKERIQIVWEGTNDYFQLDSHYGGNTTTCTNAITANIQSTIDGRRLAGCNGGVTRTFVLTLHKTTNSAGDSRLEAVRTAVNAWIMSQTNFTPIDIASYSFLSDPTNTTYVADGTHLTQAGYDLLGQNISDAIYLYV